MSIADVVEYGDAYRTAQAFGAAARRDGVGIRQGCAVTGLLTDAAGVRGVRLGGGKEIASRTVAVAAGPLSVALVAPLGIDLPVIAHREQLVIIAAADPDHYSDHADPGLPETAVEKISHRLPRLPDAAVTSTYAGCYDVTPDYNPVIGPTGVDGLLVAAGFSGHGFEISTAVGELVADLVPDGRSNDPLVPEPQFRLIRFDDGSPLRSPHPYVGAGEMR